MLLIALLLASSMALTRNGNTSVVQIRNIRKLILSLLPQDSVPRRMRDSSDSTKRLYLPRMSVLLQAAVLSPTQGAPRLPPPNGPKNEQLVIAHPVVGPRVAASLNPFLIRSFRTTLEAILPYFPVLPPECHPVRSPDQLRCRSCQSHSATAWEEDILCPPLLSIPSKLLEHFQLA